MQWLNDWLLRWRIAREARRENFLKALANRTPGFQWIIVKAGTPEQSRSPMLSVAELRDWFREYYPGCKIVQLDEVNKILFYE